MMEKQIVNVKTLSALLLSSFLLAGCSLMGVKPLEVQTTAIQKPALAVQDPAPLQPRPLKWFIITPENADEVFKELEKNNYDLVLFGITDQGYENLSLNQAEIRALIVEQKKIIAIYRTYYESDQK